MRRNYALSFGKRRNCVTSYVEAYDLVDLPKTHNLWFLICLKASYLSFVKQRVPRQINMWEFRYYPTVHNRQVMKPVTGLQLLARNVWSYRDHGCPSGLLSLLVRVAVKHRSKVGTKCRRQCQGASTGVCRTNN